MIVPQSILDPAGTGARLANDQWWQMSSTLGAIYVALAVFLMIVILRRSTSAVASPVMPDPASAPERSMARVVTGSTVLTAILLVVFLVTSLSVGHAIVHLTTDADVQVKVTGHQWWWEIEYSDPVAGNTVVTANELHVPVGKTVDLALLSADVIHSFWVPQLAGKRDLIPGRNNHIVLKAEQPGEFVGQCAEFCGLQHAHMRILVVAESEDEFRKWLEHERSAAAAPASDKELRGQQAFTSGPCVMCHTVRGTIAGSRVGPELTHVASRRTLAAGTIPNTREHLFAWITDAQSIKPGNRMPQVPMDGAQLADLVAYLESLR